MSLKFIFMLTRNDQTIKDAEEHLETVVSCGVKHIGFKDIGTSRVVRLSAAQWHTERGTDGLSDQRSDGR